ncbi:MAG TPA: DUF2341 domain-containing protein, partial [Candidatus Eisenbacteria bacterium]|nr:DUF2341 domain-containing protein [Candidatus Eisenbacteria bacterium]
ADPPWFDAAWGYRMKVTASSVLAQGGPIRDYNLVIRLTSAEAAVFDHAQIDGTDLVVTKRNGQTLLPREIVSFDPVRRQAEIWVRVDTLSTSIKDFYLYYGNAFATLPSTDPDVWPAELLAVYHMNDDPGAGIVTDSGEHQNDARTGLESQYTSSDTIPGAVGQAWLMNGTTHWIDGDGLSSTDSSFTVSAWFACWNQGRDGDADFAFSVDQGFWHLSAKRNFVQRVPDAIGNNGFITWPPNPLPDTLLHYYVWSMDGVNDTIRFYYDGVEQTPLVKFSPTGKRIYTGHNIGGQVGIAGPLFGNNNHFDLMEGILDEFRVRQGITSSARVASEYRNQKSKLFLTYGPEEPYGFVPVRLLVFQASWAGDVAEIRWELAESPAIVSLSRIADDGSPVLIIESSNMRGQVTDAGAPASGASYRLDVVARNGDASRFGPVRIGPRPVLPLTLIDIDPNPFRAGTRIGFRVDEDGEVRLRVFDLSGREVASPWTRWVTAGAHETTWNGRNERGQSLPAGMYLLRLETRSQAVTRKVIRVP